ncbi:MAG: DedA family protein [Planctomycetota bacterium]|nr:MAG: DedA family protein [Planctomycetota bacterium]REJ91642.1 MAG: DedA family protein [Planctomycetota bacterium]REK19988.1 MAG: DedA family protein [Planctomycetota bacterium]REK27555.1 MAG: DedA family protein [Planctomycetota bacterium]
MEDFILETVKSVGYVGVALLMLAENILPPIPSEIVMPAAGASASRGDHSLIGMIVAGTIGAVLGSLPWYGIARYVGTERFADWADRHGHWLGTNRKEIERADDWFDHYGRWAILIGRLVPGIRTLIGVPAGFAEMPLAQYLVYTTIGTAAWTALLAVAGYWLQGQHEAIATVVKWIGVGVFVFLCVWYVARIIVRKREKQQSSPA